jgi:HlyD family secretion protein
MRPVTTRKIVALSLIGLTAILIPVVAVGIVLFKRAAGTRVEIEAIAPRDLSAVVSASGKIRAKREVNITSEVSGRVTRLAVKEGDKVKRGDFLLQIDPRVVASQVERGEAGLAAQRAALAQAKTQLVAARANLAMARQNLVREQELLKQKLTSNQSFERVENEVTARSADVETREAEITSAEQRIRQQGADLDSARYNLSRVTLDAPIGGVITRRNVEEGETAQVGFTNNPSVVLLTVADMSVIEAQIEVDETDIPTVQLGQPTKITIDALPDRTFAGRVTEIGNSPISTAGAAGQQATNFRVVVTLDEAIPEVRPGFTCTAEITTATRSKVASVPIQAMAVRELIYDKDGKIVPQAPGKKRKLDPKAKTEDTLPEGQTRKETEGVFVVREGKAAFVPVKTGIAGDRYFEILSGLAVGDKVITGPVSSVRDLADGTAVRATEKTSARRDAK